MSLRLVVWYISVVVLVLVRVDSLAQMGGNLAQVTSPLWSVSHLKIRDN